VQVASTDAEGTPRVSSASYHANTGGVIDPGQTAPVTGNYQGVFAMGLLWSMRVTSPVPLGGYAWSSHAEPGLSTAFGFTVTVSVRGAKVASTSFQREHLLSFLAAFAADGGP
jgi:Acyl-CoA thioester hydrolase/BAAT N-terminal region